MKLKTGNCFALLLPLICSYGTVVAAPFAFTYLDGVYGTAYIGSYFLGINDAGQIVGSTGLSDNVGTASGAFLFQNGVFTSLNTPTFFPIGINDAGQILEASHGLSGIPSQLLSNGVATPLPDVPGAAPGTTTYIAVNSSGSAIGTSSLGSFFFSSGVFTPFAGPPGATQFILTGLNDAGQIVGSYYTSNPNTLQGFEFSNGVFTSINVPGATGYTELGGISNNGDMIGFYTIKNGGGSAFLDVNGVFTDLGFVGSEDFAALGVNSSGEVVGFYDMAPEPASLILIASGLAGLYGWRRLSAA